MSISLEVNVLTVICKNNINVGSKYTRNNLRQSPTIDKRLPEYMINKMNKEENVERNTHKTSKKVGIDLNFSKDTSAYDLIQLIFNKRKLYFIKNRNLETRRKIKKAD